MYKQRAAPKNVEIPSNSWTQLRYDRLTGWGRWSGKGISFYPEVINLIDDGGGVGGGGTQPGHTSHSRANTKTQRLRWSLPNRAVVVVVVVVRQRTPKFMQPNESPRGVVGRRHRMIESSHRGRGGGDGGMFDLLDVIFPPPTSPFVAERKYRLGKMAPWFEVKDAAVSSEENSLFKSFSGAGWAIKHRTFPKWCGFFSDWRRDERFINRDGHFRWL